MSIIKVGSRDSVLAVTQSEIIIEDIRKQFPQYKTELVTMKTTGDKILNKTLDKIGGKGLFVKELDMALREGRVDITVHSLKDMPADIPEDLPLIAFSKRANPYDVLVLPEGESEIDFSKPIGCASARRALQLREIYPNADIKPVRGNVQTRLKKLDSGEYCALVLAAAGLERLGLERRISRRFTADEMLPSAGQGIIAVQCRRGNGFEFLSDISDREAEICATAERCFIKKLNGGCTAPSAAYCVIENNQIYLRGMNEVNGKVKKAEIRAEIEYAQKAGEELAERLMI